MTTTTTKIIRSYKQLHKHNKHMDIYNRNTNKLKSNPFNLQPLSHCYGQSSNLTRFSFYNNCCFLPVCMTLAQQWSTAPQTSFEVIGVIAFNKFWPSPEQNFDLCLCISRVQQMIKKVTKVSETPGRHPA